MSQVHCSCCQERRQLSPTKMMPSMISIICILLYMYALCIQACLKYFIQFIEKKKSGQGYRNMSWVTDQTLYNSDDFWNIE